MARKKRVGTARRPSVVTVWLRDCAGREVSAMVVVVRRGGGFALMTELRGNCGEIDGGWRLAVVMSWRRGDAGCRCSLRAICYLEELQGPETKSGSGYAGAQRLGQRLYPQ